MQIGTKHVIRIHLRCYVFFFLLKPPIPPCCMAIDPIRKGSLLQSRGRATSPRSASISPLIVKLQCAQKLEIRTIAVVDFKHTKDLRVQRQESWSLSWHQEEEAT
ncbi:hypothetical protein TNCT_136011 [Trichonephila clavata]|uniref:Uncharacterized protein n=1 Tax=Trichonephila clavata TaxID=2740835 RepID=A0A8X6I6D7_TRICU|nr:hypothetical protein TNCT_136011 [Trichonephila clavata]